MYIQGSPRQDLETCKSPQRDYSVCECVTLSCCCYFCSPLTAGKRWRSGEFPFVWTERNREMLAFTVRTHNVIVLLKASKVVVNLNHLSPAGKVGIKLSYTKTDGCRRSSSSSSPQNCVLLNSCSPACQCFEKVTRFAGRLMLLTVCTSHQ